MIGIDNYRSKAYVVQDMDSGVDSGDIFGLGHNPLSQHEVLILLYSLKIFYALFIEFLAMIS